MAKISVGDIRKAIEGMDDADPVELDLADPPEDSNFVIDGVGNYGGTLQISISDGSLYGEYGDDEDDED